MPNAGKTLMIVGGVLLAITAIISLAGYFLLSRGTAFLTDPGDEKLAEGTGNFTAYLEEGKSYQVWTEEETASVEIMDPGEKRIYPDTYPLESSGWIMAGEFTADVSGEYRFTMNPPDRKAIVTDEIDMAEDMEENAFSWMFAIIGWQCAACLGPIGFLMLLVGVIFFFIERSKRESTTTPALPGSFTPPRSKGTSTDPYEAAIGMTRSESAPTSPTPSGMKVCRSCGLQIDQKYSKCPYCDKPVSGKKSFWGS